MKNLWRIVTVVAIVVFGCVGCVGCADCFLESEGGLLDYITGNSLRRDKAQWDADLRADSARRDDMLAAKEADVRLAAERVREEQAVLAKVRAAHAIEQERTEQLRLEKEIARAQADALEAEAVFKALEGQLLVDKAVADSLTRSSRMHAILEIVVSIFALFGVGVGLGVIYSYLRDKVREN